MNCVEEEPFWVNGADNKILNDGVKADASILVHIEDEQDEVFWRPLLTENAPNFNFEFIPFAEKRNFDGTIRECRGKDYVLKNFGGRVDHNRIICIDSDYDFLLPNSRNHSKLMYRKRKYIFQTYTYSIENFICSIDNISSCLLTICTELSKRDIRKIFSFYRCFDKIIFPLFALSVYLEKKHRENQGTHPFKIKEFEKIYSDMSIPFSPVEYLKQLRKNVRIREQQLLNEFEHEESFSKFREDLRGQVVKFGSLANLLRTKKILSTKSSASYVERIMTDIVIQKINFILKNLWYAHKKESCKKQNNSSSHTHIETPYLERYKKLLNRMFGSQKNKLHTDKSIFLCELSGVQKKHIQLRVSNYLNDSYSRPHGNIAKKIEAKIQLFSNIYYVADEKQNQFAAAKKQWH
jgi:hypothetical protein